MYGQLMGLETWLPQLNGFMTCQATGEGPHDMRTLVYRQLLVQQGKTNKEHSNNMNKVAPRTLYAENSLPSHQLNLKCRKDRKAA